MPEKTLRILKNCIDEIDNMTQEEFKGREKESGIEKYYKTAMKPEEKAIQILQESNRILAQRMQEMEILLEDCQKEYDAVELACKALRQMEQEEGRIIKTYIPESLKREAESRPEWPEFEKMMKTAYGEDWELVIYNTSGRKDND